MLRRRGFGAAAVLAGVLLLLGVAGPAAAENSSVPIPNYPRPIALSPDGTRGYVAAAVGGGAPGILTEFDTATDEVLRTVAISEPEPFELAVSPDGTRIFVSNDSFTNGPIGVVDVASFTQVDTWTIPIATGGTDDGVAQSLAFDADGILYASLRDGARLVALDPMTGAEIASYPVGALPADVVIDPVLDVAYVAVSSGLQVARVDLTGTDPTSYIDAFPSGGPSPYTLALSPDGSQLWAGGYGFTGAMSRIDTATGTVGAAIAVANRQQFAVTGDGSRLYVTAGGNQFGVYDTADGTLIGTVDVPGDPRFLAIESDGVHAWVSSVLGASVSLVGPPLPQQPADQSVTEGETATFTASIRASYDTIQWQSSPDGLSWTDVPGATGLTLDVAATLADDGTRYRFVASSILFGEATSGEAALTVAALPPEPTPTPTPTPEPTPIPEPTPTPSPSPTPQPELAESGFDPAPAAELAGFGALLGALLIAGGRRIRRSSR